MKKEYEKHDEEFKKMIVNLCETNKDKTMSDIAREYGSTRTSITNWRKKYGTITTSTGETTSNDEILKLKKDEIFHSDRGSQYTSNDFEYLLEKLENKHSYSKKGYPYDNESMESFNAKKRRSKC